MHTNNFFYITIKIEINFINGRDKERECRYNMLRLLEMLAI